MTGHGAAPNATQPAATTISKSKAKRLKKQLRKAENAAQAAPANDGKKRKPRAARRRIQKNVITRSLEEQGIDHSTAQLLASGVYYDGLPMANISIPGIVQDIIYNAQICALHMIARYPQILYDPTDEVSGKTIGPTEIVAYLLVCALCHFRKLGLLSGLYSEFYSDVFNEEYEVPVPFAKYLEYACRFDGPPRMQTVINLTADFTLSVQQITAPTGTLNNDLSQLQIFSNSQTAKAVQFPVKLQAGDWTIFTGPYTPVNYTGVTQGSRAFISTQFMENFSRLLTGIDVIETIKFKSIATNAPDCSAWATPYGNSTAVSNWTEYSGVICANRHFDVDMTMLCRPNFNFSATEILPFPLGHQTTVPQPTAPNYVSDTSKLTASGLNLTQQMDWFYWNGMRSEYAPGTWRGPKGFKTKSGFRLPRFFEVVSREIDTYGLTKQALIGLLQFAQSNVNGFKITDDFIDMFVQFFETLLIAKTFAVGNWSLQGGIGVNVTLSMQQLLPNLAVMGKQVPIFVKAIIDQVGVTFADGALYMPQVTVNAFGTLAGPAPNWQNWPKFGSVLQAGGPDNNRYIGATVGSVAFPFIPADNPCSDEDGTSSAPSSCQLITGGGGFTDDYATVAGTLVWEAGVQSTALNALIAAQALAAVGSYNANFVFWQAPMPGIAEFVCSLFGSSQLAQRGVTGTINDDTSLGGPSMFMIQLSAPREENLQQRYSMPHYSVTQNADVPPKNASVFHAYLPLKYNYFVPLSPSDHGLAISVPVSTIYKQTIVPYSMATAFIEVPVGALGNTATDDVMAQLTQIDGPAVTSYRTEAMKNHKGKVSILHRQAYRSNRDCLRKAMLGIGERAQTQFTQVDWVKVTRDACRWGVGAVGLGLLRPACGLIPHVYKIYKSIRDNYDGNHEKEKPGKSSTPLLMNASH